MIYEITNSRGDVIFSTDDIGDLRVFLDAMESGDGWD